MASKNRHPEREILEFASGALVGPSRDAVQAHLAECSKCSAVAAVVGALKKHARERSGPDLGGGRSMDSGPVAYGSVPPAKAPPAGEPGPANPSLTSRKDLEFKDLVQDADVSRPALTLGSAGCEGMWESMTTNSLIHLDGSELAAFYHGELPAEAATAAAGHVAMCSACSSAISLFRESDSTAQSGEHSSAGSLEMSDQNWRPIKEWEGNCLAEPRPASEAPSREMLDRFLEILRDHKEEIDRVAAGLALGREPESTMPKVVPVVVLDSAGLFRGVEAFHRVSRPRGLEALQCKAKPFRYHNLPIHALLGTDRQYPMVVSSRIDLGIAELDYRAVQATSKQPLGYFIVEN